MAYKLILSQSNPVRMPFIWNVSTHVGPAKRHPNRATDVELVQFLLAESLKRGWPDEPSTSGAAVPPVTVDGRFNAVLGFWIFYSQQCSATPAASVDGVVSPAHGVMYGGGAWVIVRLNNYLWAADTTFWSKLDNDPRLSPGLRSELKRTAP